MSSKNNDKLSREEIRKVAERYGFEVEFDSDKPGVTWVDEDGNEKHMTHEEAFDWAFGPLFGDE